MIHRIGLVLLTAIITLVTTIVGGVSPVVAAPIDQAEEEAALQVWVSNVYPAASGPGMIALFALYPNQNVEYITIYLSEAVFVETGVWEAGTGGEVTLTLTGNTERQYDEPHTVLLTPDGDLLTDGVFDFHAREVVTPAAMDALAAGDSDALTDTTVTSESDDLRNDAAPRRVWLSNLYPAADAAGLLTLLVLYDNGAMEQHAIYLTKGVISEVGVWEEDADQMIVVTATGTFDETYREPVTVTYTHGDDMLRDGAFALARWPEVTPQMMANAVDPAGVYSSNVYPAADAAGYIAVLALYENGHAEQTTIYLTKGAVSELGTWAAAVDGSLTVTMTAQLDGDEYRTPAVTQYARDGEILTDGPFMLFKLEEITPAMMDELTTSAVRARYQSDTLPAASSPGRIITLTIFDDGTLTFDTDYLNDEPVVMQVGTWEENADGTLTITITGTADETYAEPDVITFATDGNQIVAVEYDEAQWGSEGLTLTEQRAE